MSTTARTPRPRLAPRAKVVQALQDLVKASEQHRKRDVSALQATLVRTLTVLTEKAPDLGNPQLDADLYARWESERVARATRILCEQVSREFPLAVHDAVMCFEDPRDPEWLGTHGRAMWSSADALRDDWTKRGWGHTFEGKLYQVYIVVVRQVPAATQAQGEGR